MYTIVDLCLLCHANNKNLKSIVSQDSDGILIQEKLRVFLFELVNMEPEISKHICLHCLRNLNQVYNFKQLCLRNIAKFNSYIRTLKNTEEPCKNLQVTLIDLKYFKPKNEKDSKSEPTKTENLNLDNVIVKSNPNEDGTGIEFVLQGKHKQTTEEIDEKLRIENNVVKTEPENMTDNDDNNKIQEENIIKEVDANIENDELKYEIVIEEPEDIFCDEIDLKSVLDDLKDKVKNEKVNNADEVNHEIMKEKPEEICDEVDIKQELDDYLIDKLACEPIYNEDEQHSFGGCDSDLEPFEDSGSDDEYLPSNASSTASEASNSDLELIEIQSPASSTLAVPKGTNSDVTKYTSECLSTSNTRIRSTEENSQSSERGDKGQSIDVITHKQTNATRHKCDDCGEGFNQTSKLIRHKRKIHKDLKPFKCDICGKAFTHPNTLVDHNRIHTGEKPHICDICGKAFRISTHLIRHRLIHTGEKPHKCDICGKAFNQSSSLVSHIRTHSNEKPHKCDICGKAFRMSTHLIRHRLIHTGEKPHKCDICGKAFNQSSSLVSHIRTHSNEKPHKCDICGKAFRMSTHLIRHRLIHTGEKPHKCDICGKAFRLSTHLIEHRLIHTGEKPHKCDICDRAFRLSTHLIGHRLIHTGEKPHKCDICDRAFRRSTALIRHRLIHTGEKPHKCDICGKAFTQKSNLRQHRRTH